MYYTNIADDEVKIFHKKSKVNASYSELLSISPNFISKKNKIIPMFYFDTIKGNGDIRILEDKCILYFDNEDLNSIYFKSAKENIIVDCSHEIVLLNDNVFLKLHFYDKDSLFGLSDLKFYFEQIGEFNGDYVTDMYGNAIIKLNSRYGDFIVKTNNQEFNWSVI